MKFRLTFKTPDVLDQLEDQGLTEAEVDAAKRKASLFIQYREYITVEFDSDHQTPVVLYLGDK